MRKNLEIYFFYSVCKPVRRLISRYYHAVAIGGPRVAELGADFSEYQTLLTNVKNNASSYFDPIMSDPNVPDGIQQIMETLVVRKFITNKNEIYLDL